MSEPFDDKLLDENLSRLLNDAAEPPTMSDQVGSEMLAALKAKQHDLYRPKEKPMEKAIAVPARNQWTVAAAAIAIVASLILLAWFLAPGQHERPNNIGPGSLPNQIAKTTFDAKDVSRNRLEDGTVVIAHQGSRYTVDAPRQITLEQGDLYFIVAKSDKPFVVTTTHGKVQATGTRFTVSTGKGTLTAVAQGSVTLSNKQGKVQLGAGQQGKLEKGMRPTREPAPRLSHLVSWAKEALSQDELLVEKAEKKEGLIALDPWGQEVQLTLRKYNVDVYIEDGIARTTIDQTFFNHNPWNTEGTFYFPLPPDASVSRLAMYVAGNLNEGGMVERGRGQDIYARIRYQNRDPALLEMMQGNVFKMRIFPLEGRQAKRVFLSYTQKLDELYGTMRYWFPMDHTNSIAKQLSIKLHVKDGVGTFEAKSSTHKLDVKKDGDDLVLRYDAKQVRPDQDLLLHLLPAKKIESSRVATCSKDGFKFVFGRFTPVIPGKVETKPRQWIVLNDISASRSKIEAKAQRYIVERLAKEADDGDRVTIINLNTKAEMAIRNVPVKDVRPFGFVPKDGPAGHPTFVWPEGRRVGGTNMSAGIQAVAEIIKDLKSENPHILYLGDGVATDGATEVFSLVRAIPRSATFVGIGVGKKVDSLFLQAAADQTGGIFTTINPDDDIDWRVFDMIAALNTPRMTKIKVKLLSDSGKEMPVDTIAYPSKRSLSEGETLTVVARCEKDLPAEIKVEGKVGNKTESFVVSMDDAKADAEYIPRLWAKRHIDELTKSDMERKDEIISLSKQYYVVTPFTSLIVLENDAMYTEFNVERGRKDHWALYPAPKKIEVVHEPMDWSKRKWGWYGYGPGDDAKIKAKEKPQSIQEIVDSVQFRINAPFYYSRPQQSGHSRHALYQLLDNKGDPTRLLTYWMLLASGAEETAAALRSTHKPDHEGSVQKTLGASKNPANQQMLGFIGKDMLPPALLDDELRLHMHGEMNGDFSGPMTSRLISLEHGQRDRLRMLGTALSADVLTNRETAISKLHLIADLPDYQPMTMAYANNATIRGFTVANESKQAMPIPALLQSTGLSTSSHHWVQPQLADSFRRALNKRWSRINNDIQQFNRQYGYWDDWSGWGRDGRGSIDLTKTSNFYDYGGLNELMDLQEESELAPLAQLVAGNSDEKSMPMQSRTVADGGWYYQPSPRVAMAWVGMYSDSIKNQPGVASVLGADYLVKRRTELLKKPNKGNTTKELEILNKAIDGLGAAASRLEDTGPFWGHQGWNYRPQQWTFQAPTVQAYQHYNWSFDLTRYAPALYSNSSDVLNEVVAQYGLPKPQGKVATGAAKKIEAARRAVRPTKIRFSEDGPEVYIASDDRYLIVRQTDMYLEERMVCDGTNVLHLYDELGFAARRPATSLRLGSLRQLAPHILEPVDSLARRFDIALAAEYKDGFDLKLTPIGQNDKAKQIHMILSATNHGEIRNKVLYVDGKQQLNLALQHTGDQVIVRWLDPEDKELAKLAYDVESLKSDVPSFEVDQSKYVMFDMPLRKASYYAQKLEKLDDKEVDERVQLNRHQALATIQEFHRRRWGQPNTDARKCLTAAFDSLKQLKAEPTIGDLTLLLATGRWDAVNIMKQWKNFDDSLSIIQYAQTRQGWQDESEDDKLSLISHLAAYQAAIQNAKVTPKFDHLKTTYPKSPLLLAATFYCANSVNKPEVWSELYDNSDWRGMALLMLAGRLSTDDQRKTFVAAFEKWHTELSELGYHVPITPQVAQQMRASRSDAWKSLVQARFELVKKTDRIAPLLKFVEDITSWGETDLASEALQLARERLGKQKEQPLLGRFALAQTLWASGRPKEALAEYDEILKSLDQDMIPATPALLASIARLAQHSGDHSRAIDFEERALAAEHEYLPDMINIQAFRQRYNWLWEQYKQKVAAAVSEDDKPTIEKYMELAESAWQRWYEIDQDNNSMVQQMATLQMTANRPARAWLYLSTIIDKKPRDASSCNAMSQWYNGRGELDEAQQWLARAAEWETSNPQWLFQRGQVLDKMGRNQEARDAYQKVINGKWAPGLQRWVNQAKKAIQ